jgi:hypothetical protein
MAGLGAFLTVAVGYNRVTARGSFPPFGGDELMTVYGTGGKIRLTGQWLGYWGEADPGAQ